jgi:predicted PurR-regulated permease PerM
MNIDNVLKPKLIGGEAKMHPLLVLLSILGGLNVFGFIGFIVGPVITAVCILIIEFYVKDFAPGSLDSPE